VKCYKYLHHPNIIIKQPCFQENITKEAKNEFALNKQMYNFCCLRKRFEIEIISLFQMTIYSVLTLVPKMHDGCLPLTKNQTPKYLRLPYPIFNDIDLILPINKCKLSKKQTGI